MSMTMAGMSIMPIKLDGMSIPSNDYMETTIHDGMVRATTFWPTYSPATKE